MKARIPNFFAFLMLYYFPLHLSATTSFYTTFNSKTFDGPDKQITNSTNPTQRTYSSSVNQKFYASNYSFMVGISDIEILSNKYVDFLISNISSGSSGTTSVGLKVYPYSALNSLTYTAIAAASGTIPIFY